ncbi:MAG: hypothetical protein ACM3TN_25155, partial [Alphaproteobacteria bacterium]
EKIDLSTVIQEVISTFCRNRIGDKPPIYVTLAPAMAPVPWQNRALKDFVRCFLYDALLTNDPDAAIEVTLKRCFPLKDLNAFVGIQPSYWLQLRVSGRGLRIMEPLVEELFADLGYRCEEWLGVEKSKARLGIFGAVESSGQKMVFCLAWSHAMLKSDLLLPVIEHSSASYLTSRAEGRVPQT